jgi:hypothetical protein
MSRKKGDFNKTGFIRMILESALLRNGSVNSFELEDCILTELEAKNWLYKFDSENRFEAISKIRETISKMVSNKQIFRDGNSIVLESKTEAIDFFSNEEQQGKFLSIKLPLDLHKESSAFLTGDVIVLGMVSNVGKTVSSLETTIANAKNGLKTIHVSTETQGLDLHLSFLRYFHPNIYKDIINKYGGNFDYKDFPLPKKIKKLINDGFIKVVFSDGFLSGIDEIKNYDLVVFDHLIAKEGQDFKKLQLRIAQARVIANQNNQIIIITTQLKEIDYPKKNERPYYITGGNSLVNPTALFACFYIENNTGHCFALKIKRGKSKREVCQFEVDGSSRLKRLPFAKIKKPEKQ